MISQTEDGIRLHRWFGRHYPKLSQIELRKLCRTGQVRLNSGRCRGNEILKAGDMVRIPPSAESARRAQTTDNRAHKTETGERFSLSDLEQLRKCIIHNDADIVAFNKPAGLATQGGTGVRKSLDKMAAALFPFDTMLLVHRLDRETSGLIVMAKNQRAAQALAAEFQDKSARKVYLALLSGNVSPKSGTIDNFIAAGHVVPADRIDQFKKENDAKPVRAVTEYAVLNELPNVATWVKFMPLTGRTHQLRLHAAETLFAPIVGDDLYQPKNERRKTKNDDDASLVSRLSSFVDGNHLFLFAYRLTFRHPGTGRVMTLSADLPDFMKGVVKFLEFKIP